MKYTFIFIMVMLVASVNSVVIETASFRDFLYGSTEDTEYDNWISHVSRGIAVQDYNQYAPFELQENGFGDFFNPGFTVRSQWAQVIEQFVAENFQATQDLIEQYGFPFQVIEFHNTDNDEVYYVIRENLNMDYFTDNGYPDHPEMHVHGSFDYGWGLFVFNPNSENHVIITAPHPKDDFITGPISYEAMVKWDARYMLINGAGREVLWTNVPPYWNSKSLSDPSRNGNHPFHIAYKIMCDEIRDTFGKREWSPQIHSYDYTHMGFNNLQISAGNADLDYPGLPIRDTSNNFLDIVNVTPYVVLPANTVGIHEEVLITDYYSILYDLHGFYFQHEDSLITVCNTISHPGFGNNNQIVYSNQNWNKYDVFSPSFHIEMEELPSIYPQNMNYYKWFYGYNAETGLWDTDNFYTNAITYYTPWIDAIAEILPGILNLENDILPPVPQNLAVDSTSLTNIILTWDRVEAYDFNSYQILYSTEPINLEDNNYTIVDRTNIQNLAAQAFDMARITGLSAATEYYFAIRTKDVAGNLSDLSEQVSAVTGSANVTNFRAYGYDSVVNVMWTASSQFNNAGFAIYRRDLDSDNFDEIASYQDYPDLEGSSSNNVSYTFSDFSVENGNLYVYKLASIDEQGETYLHTEEVGVSVQPIFDLNFTNLTGTVTDYISFGINHYATDGYQNFYDIVKGSNPGGNYIYSHFYHSNWNAAIRQLQRDIRGFFDLDQDYKVWTIRVSTNQLNQPITISLSDNYHTRNSEKIWLRDFTTGNFVDLAQNNMTYQASNTNYRFFYLYWGNLLPTATFASRSNQFLQPGDTFNIAWSTNFDFLISNISLLAVNNDEEFLIVDDLEPSTTSFVWDIPENLSLLDAKIVIRYLTTDGFEKDYKSPYNIGVLPLEHTFTVEPGWHFRSNPFVGFSPDVNQVFGPEAELFSFIMSGIDYIPQADFHFGEGYWLYTTDDYEFPASGDLHKFNYDFNLQYGWNLVPNVLKQPIEINNFLIILNDETYTFAEAINYQLINRCIYVNKNGINELRSKVYEEEAFWFYSMVSGAVLRFRPFNKNEDFYDFSENWKVHLLAEQGDFRKDRVTVANSIHSTDDFDLLYDLPKPPQGPDSNFLELYILNDDSGYFSQLEIAQKSDLNMEGIDFREWEFVVRVSELEPVIFKVEEFDYPQGFQTVIYLDDIEINLSVLEEYIYIPQSVETVGIIRVTNEDLSSTDDVIENSYLFFNYPNPFKIGAGRSAGTNISFYLNEKAMVSLNVYNIKGQRVKTLVSEDLSNGNHSIYWNGMDDNNKNVATGVYFYQLKVNNSDVLTRKMLLIK